MKPQKLPQDESPVGSEAEEAPSDEGSEAGSVVGGNEEEEEEGEDLMPEEDEEYDSEEDDPVANRKKARFREFILDEAGQ